MKHDRLSIRVALGALGAGIVAVAVYALLRIAQYFLFPDPNPALVIWSAHAGYFWRAWTAVYVGGCSGFLIFLAATRDAERTARALVRALTVAGVLMLVQGLFVP